MLTLRFWI